MKIKPFKVKEIDSDFKAWLEKFFHEGYEEIEFKVISYGYKCYRFNLYSYNALFMEIDLFKINEGYNVEMAYLLFREGIPSFLQNLEIQLRSVGYANARIYDNDQWQKRVYEFCIKHEKLEIIEGVAYPPEDLKPHQDGKYYIQYCPWPPIKEYEDRLPAIPGGDEPAPATKLLDSGIVEGIIINPSRKGGRPKGSLNKSTNYSKLASKIAQERKANPRISERELAKKLNVSNYAINQALNEFKSD